MELARAPAFGPTFRKVNSGQMTVRTGTEKNGPIIIIIKGSERFTTFVLYLIQLWAFRENRAHQQLIHPSEKFSSRSLDK